MFQSRLTASQQRLLIPPLACSWWPFTLASRIWNCREWNQRTTLDTVVLLYWLLQLDGKFEILYLQEFYKTSVKEWPLLLNNKYHPLKMYTSHKNNEKHLFFQIENHFVLRLQLCSFPDNAYLIININKQKGKLVVTQSDLFTELGLKNIYSSLDHCKYQWLGLLQWMPFVAL